MTEEKKQSRLPVDLDPDDVAWFKQQYPNGSLSGTLSMLLSAFREVNQFTPKDYALKAAELLTERVKK